MRLLDVPPAPALPSMASLRPWATLNFDPVEHEALRLSVARQLRCAPDALGRFHELELARGDAPKKKRRRTTGKNADPDALRALVVAYHSLVTRLIAPHLATHVPCDEIFFQASPALRVHAPSAHAAGNRHRDSGYGHQASQVNFWLPLAPAFGTNTLHVENLRGDGRAVPLEGDFGVVHRFWGHELYHHTLPNDTPATRVSLDFRAVPGPLFEAQAAFFEGGYYARARRAADGWAVVLPEGHTLLRGNQAG